MIKEKLKIKTLIEYLTAIDEAYEVYGDTEKTINGFSSIYDYQNGTMTWIRSKENLEKAEVEPSAITLLISTELIEGCPCCITAKDPHRLFFYLIEYFFCETKEVTIGKNSIISMTASIGKNVAIGNNCTIGENVQIGDETRIYNNVSIADNVVIGENCTIKSGAVIGEEGFGFLKDKNGIQHRVPHMGSVIIGNYVDIGANTCIDRGVMENTIIKDHAKIDNLCHIAHNTEIGQNTTVVALTLLGGSTKVGDNCWIGTSTIRNLLEIGDNAFIGIGSNVVGNVEKDTLVYGNPAKKRK
mgnify:CR=1 FL=1